MRGVSKVVQTLGLLVVVGTSLGGARAQGTAPVAKQPAWSWGGDVRLRLELIDYGKPVHTPLDKGVRLRAKIGAQGEVADGKVAWGVRLATMPTDARSANLTRNTTLGGGNLNSCNQVGVDLAYVTLRPTKSTSLTLGKQLFPFWGCDGLFSTADLTPEGAVLRNRLHTAAKGAVVGDVSNTLAFIPLSLSKGANAFMLGDQVKTKLGNVDTALSCFFYDGMRNAPKYTSTYYFYPNDKLTILAGKALWPVPGLKKFPLVLSGEAFDNVNIKRQSWGLEARVDAPKVGQHGKLALTLRTVGKNATWDGWIEPNFGCNVGYKNGVRVEYMRSIEQNLTWRVAGFRYTPTSGSVGRATGRFHCDLLYTF